MSEDIKATMSALAKVGGIARARSLTPEARSESARKAANARWSRGESEIVIIECKTPGRIPAASSHVEIDAYDELLRRSLDHIPSPSCPCDDCVDTVIEDIRTRYTAVLKKIDAKEPLDGNEVGLFKFVLGSKPDRWTRVYRQLRKGLQTQLQASHQNHQVEPENEQLGRRRRKTLVADLSN